jgi:hypothetical protein
VRFIAIEVLSSPVSSRGAAPAGQAEGIDQRAKPDGALGCRVVIDQVDIRAWRCRLAPGEAAPPRRASGPFLRVMLPPGVPAADQAAGTATWHEDAGPLVTNSGSSPMEFVDLEWK